MVFNVKRCIVLLKVVLVRYVLSTKLVQEMLHDYDVIYLVKPLHTDSVAEYLIKQ